jgi:hypothetical protein
MWGKALVITLSITGLNIPGKAQAQPLSTVISDFESSRSTNNMGGYWYFYDDQRDSGSSTISTANAEMQYQWDSTTYVPGSGGSETGVKLGFLLGETKPHCGIGCTYPAQVGMGTQILGGADLDITGATAISFWAKADAPIKVVFTATTSDILDNGGYAKVVSVTMDWAKYTVALSPGKDFAQPNWAIKKTFDPTHFMAVGWMIDKGINTGLTKGAFYLDNVIIDGWEPKQFVDHVSFSAIARQNRASRIIGNGNQIYVKLAKSRLP